MNKNALFKRVAVAFVTSSFLLGCNETEIKPVGQGAESQDSESVEKIGSDKNAKRAPLVLLGGTAGIFRASGLGDTFEASNTGLSGQSMIAQAFLSTNGRIYAGTKKGVYVSKDGGQSWSASNKGMSGSGLNVVALHERGGVLYAGTFGGGVYKSTDGKNWVQHNSGLTNLRLIVRAFAEYNGKMYIGTHNGVYRLSTDGTTWRTVNTGLVGAEARLVVGLAAYNGSLYAATYGGYLKEMNDGANWMTIDDPEVNDRYINTLAVVGDKLYVGFNYAGVQIYDGNAFTEFNDGLPAFFRPRALAVKGDEVLLTSIYSGTYYSVAGSSWVENSGEEDDADYWGILFQ